MWSELAGPLRATLLHVDSSRTEFDGDERSVITYPSRPRETKASVKKPTNLSEHLCFHGMGNIRWKPRGRAGLLPKPRDVEPEVGAFGSSLMFM